MRLATASATTSTCYANDLDLFGRGSLFELLSIARTRAGEETLASWLKAPASPDQIAGRHAAVAELTPALDLREALSLAGSDVRAGVDPDELVAWAEGPARLFPAWKQAAAVALSAVTVVTVSVWLVTGNYLPMLFALAVQGVFQGRQRSTVDAVLHAADAPARELSILFHVLNRLEREKFSSPRLVELHEQIGGEGEPAAMIIRRLQRLVEAHDWEHNMVFTPIAAVLMWGTHVAWGIERWRGRNGHRIGAWLRAVGEIEALSSLSAYRYRASGRSLSGDRAGHSSEPGTYARGVRRRRPWSPAAARRPHGAQ